MHPKCIAVIKKYEYVTWLEYSQQHTSNWSKRYSFSWEKKEKRWLQTHYHGKLMIMVNGGKRSSGSVDGSGRKNVLKCHLHATSTIAVWLLFAPRLFQATHSQRYFSNPGSSWTSSRVTFSCTSVCKVKKEK